jgi:methionyl aminopeptidase
MYRSSDEKMWDQRMTVKTEDEIAKIRESSHIVHETFQYVQTLIRPGISTMEINDKADQFILSKGGIPAFKGYKVGKQTFRYATCMSKNDAVVHGIPNEELLKEGDTISVDIGVEKDGWFGDSAWTYAVGEIAPETAKLMEITKDSLLLGIAAARAGGRLYDISKAIQDYCESNGYGVVKDLVGHGIGRHLHEEPQVPNYVLKRFDPAYRNIELREGMALAIEPMINMGSWRVKTLRDGWTVVTADGKPSAHFEHTIVVRPWGGEILTK